MNKVAKRIHEALRTGGRSEPIADLLHAAYDEILQLDYAAQQALEADSQKKVPNLPPFKFASSPDGPQELVSLDVPARVLEAADIVEQHFKRKGIDHWKLLGLQSREAP